MVELGQKAKDEVTGFTGIVEAITYYLNGCCQALIRPKFKPKDKEYPKAAWIDVEQLRPDKNSKVLRLKQRKKEPPSGGVRQHPPIR